MVFNGRRRGTDRNGLQFGISEREIRGYEIRGLLHYGIQLRSGVSRDHGTRPGPSFQVLSAQMREFHHGAFGQQEQLFMREKTEVKLTIRCNENLYYKGSYRHRIAGVRGL